MSAALPFAALVFAFACAGCSGSVDYLFDEAGAPSADAAAQSGDGGASADGSATPTLPSGPPSCANGRRDGDETDVDCGGALCPTCPLGGSCAQAADCVSFECGADGRCRNDNGCADGTREGFGATASYPDIAACAGGWSLPGLVDTRAPACGRAAGNASQNPSGKDCNVADLCQVGWHVCEDASEVKTRSGGNGCAGAAFAAGAQVFFVVRQSGPGGAMCGEGENDIFGCGTVGAAPDATTCGVLDRFSHDLCSQLPATWACGSGDTSEASAVRKTAAANGGVLCCRN